MRSVEQELFKDTEIPLRYSNLSSEEWGVTRSLADDRSTVIKMIDKGSVVVAWDRDDYVKESQKQLGDGSIYRKVNYKGKLLSELVDKSNSFFKELKRKGCISGKTLKYFTYEYKKAIDLGQFYLLPKIHKRLQNVPGRPVISNCGAPTEKASEFLDFHLKRVMQNGASYAKDSNDFINKVKNIDIRNDVLLVTVDVVGLYSSITHEVGLRALKNTLENRNYKEIPTENFIKMAEFILKNNYFESDSSVFQQISGNAIGTKFAPPYACIFLDQHETMFLETQVLKPSVRFRYIDDIFFIWTHGEEKLKKFMEDFNSFSHYIKFMCDFDKESIPF